MTDPVVQTDLAGEAARLRRRIERERQARLEAETIAEAGLRQLYERQNQLELLHAIADAANAATSVNQAIQVALDAVCAHISWPVGHAYFVEGAVNPALVPSELWHLDNPKRYAAFRLVTQTTLLKVGQGLPGRVVETAQPLWITDLQSDSNFPRAKSFADIGVRSGFAFPVMVGREVVAVLEFFSSEPVQPQERVLELARHAGLQLGRVFERERSQRALRRAKEAAEAASTAKSEFLATISHEIRTPINGVVGMTEILLDTPLDDEQREFAETVRHSANALMTLINDILDFAKLENGDVSLKSAEFNWRDAVAQIAGRFTARAERKGLKLVASVADEVPVRCRGDLVRIRQVLGHLVNNAIKFTDAGEVRISVLREAASGQRDQVRVAVSDTGIGISEDARHRLFQPFVQADGSITRKHGGLGLSLATCKHLVDLMDGQLGVTSAPGQGATFWFTLELAEASAPAIATENAA